MNVSKFVTAACIAVLLAPMPALAQGNSGGAKGSEASSMGSAVSEAAKNPDTRGRAKAYDIICRVMVRESEACDSLLRAFTDFSEADEMEEFYALCEEYLFTEEECAALYEAMYPAEPEGQ